MSSAVHDKDAPVKRPLMEFTTSDTLSITGDKGCEASEKLNAGSGDDCHEDGAQPASRANWGGKIEFILTCIGYAVGLGNVWRFPYLAYKNGGGAFLIPYFFMLATVGLPLFFMELSFGQFASLGPITIWKINPMFKGLGFSMVLISWFIGLYYNVIIAHVLFYFAASMTSDLPWKHCGNEWNTDACVDSVPRPNVTDENATLAAVPSTTTLLTTALSGTAIVNTSLAVGNSSVRPVTSAEEYYYNYVLQVTGNMDSMGSGGIVWKLALALLVAWVLVLIVLIRGIQTLGKAAYFTAIFPYVMLTVLLIRGVTLDGAIEGLKYYITPNFERLADASVWQDAATQIFYSLSVCSGGLIAMASFNKFDNNCRRDSLIVALINAFTSVYAGIVIFSVLGFMAVEKNVPVSEVAQGGPGLAFVVYPEALARMPVAPMWSVFFFLMMITLGFGSIFSIVETVIAAFTDEFPKWLHPRRNNIIFRCVVCACMFLLGLPMVSKGGIYLLNLIDASISGFPLLIVGFFELIAISYIYGYKRFAHDIELMLGDKPNIYWRACWMGVSPAVLVVTVAFAASQYKDPDFNEMKYPSWAISLGWLMCVTCMLPMIIWALYYYCKNGGFELLRIHSLPLGHWGPALSHHRRGHYELFPSSGGSSAHDGSIQWSDKFNAGYIKSLHSIVSVASRHTMSESSDSELQVHSTTSVQTAGGSCNKVASSTSGPARSDSATRFFIGQSEF